MDAKRNKKDFVKWLETLQQESWQLELIISGFAIFLLLGLYEPLHNWALQLNKLRYLEFRYSFHFMNMGMDMLRITWHVLVINLIAHVFLRGLWISTIGLRYVSGDIDFEELNLSRQFNQFLQKRIGSFDSYIETLEKICSVIFAFTFLLFFIVLSFLLGAIFFLGLSEIIRYFTGFDYQQLFIPIQAPFFALAGIYAFDFITLGWLKKRSKLSKIYYPVYRFFSIITFSFLYRPLYYNLIDHKFGRRIGLLIIPYFLIFMTIANMKLNLYAYLPSNKYYQTLSINHYDDVKSPETIESEISIPSKYIDNGFIEVFLPYVPRFQNAVFARLCPDLEPFTFTFFQDPKEDPRNKLNADSTLSCMSKLYEISLDDSIHTDIKYRFYYHPQRVEEGLLTIIDVGYLSRGEHTLTVKLKYLNSIHEEGQPIEIGTNQIPFWKE